MPAYFLCLNVHQSYYLTNCIDLTYCHNPNPQKGLYSWICYLAAPAIITIHRCFHYKRFSSKDVEFSFHQIFSDPLVLKGRILHSLMTMQWLFKSVKLPGEKDSIIQKALWINWLLRSKSEVIEDIRAIARITVCWTHLEHIRLMKLTNRNQISKVFSTNLHLLTLSFSAFAA